MTNSYVTVYAYTDKGENHIFTVDSTDGQFTANTDLITGQGLGSLQGQKIVKVMAWCEAFVTQGNGVVIVNPQNVPIASIPVAIMEQEVPAWQMVNIGPIDLNWVMKQFTTASLA